MGTQKTTQEKRYARPAWIPAAMMDEEDLCPTCFKAVGDKNRYKIICILGTRPQGATVGHLTEQLGLTQPTVTHHLHTLRSVDAVVVTQRGKERVYALNRQAHCFEECKIPY